MSRGCHFCSSRTAQALSACVIDCVVAMLISGFAAGIGSFYSSHFPNCTFSWQGSRSFLHGLLGTGYGILGPYARARGWAPGAIMDWKTGATGWILWVSLAIMLGDSLTSLSLLVISSTKCTKCVSPLQPPSLLLD